MTILHLLYAGGTGGIEKLCKDIGLHDKKSQNIFVFVHEGGNIADEMEQEGLETVQLNFSNKDIIPLYRKLNELIDKYDADHIVIHHHAPLVWLACLLYLRKGNKKVFVYVHNTYNVIVRNQICRKILYNFLLKKCDGIIAISDFVKQSIVKQVNIDAAKIYVIYNGIDTENYYCKRSSSPGDEIRLIYVGRLIYDKGLDLLIDAISKMENQYKVHLTIVGDGPMRTELEEKVCALGLSSRVCFEGIQRNVKDYLQQADVFVHPARWEEGFGITIVEAMSAGLVCVAFKRGAIPEVIDNGLNGYTLEQVSDDALAKKLDEVIENLDEDNLLDMRKEAIKKANKFTIDSLVRRLNNLYES